jgi:uncharacterized protein CbrC (UPF0167 family)
MATFSELGIPFVLFEASANATSNYVGLAYCRLCNARDQHCFAVGELILPCPICGAENGFNTHTRQGVSCRSCACRIAFPEFFTNFKNLYLCYNCLRAGKGAMTKDTEFGAVTSKQAFQGLTHGGPGVRSSDFELVLVDGAEDWYAVRVPSEHLFELLRTPTFNSFQQEVWLFCCKRPMTYLGEWDAVMKSSHRPSDEKAFFDRIVELDEAYKEIVWEKKGIYGGHAGIALDIFQCKSCNRFRAVHDPS